MQQKLSDCIDLLWQKDLPFVAYRLPQQNDISLIAQLTSELQILDLKNIESVSGFVIAPFESTKTQKAYLLKPDIVIDSIEEVAKIEKIKSLPNKLGNNKIVNKIWSKETYLEKADSVINDLKNKKLQKLVLSRVIEKKLQQDFNPGVAYASLNDRYADSFNYIFHLPEIGSWIGASPETFLRISKSYIETMSLAGTKPIDNIDWTPKEIEEQAIVTDFIKNQLERLNIINYSVQDPKTLKAGNVGHLSTKFMIPIQDLQNKTGELVGALHPTPAVCGMPQQTAYEYILQIEAHDRKFYTGFLGPWQLNGQSELFVNLRCAEFDHTALHLFVGGGLTSSSVAESEWEETEYKSKTLLAIAENF